MVLEHKSITIYLRGSASSHTRRIWNRIKICKFPLIQNHANFCTVPNSSGTTVFLSKVRFCFSFSYLFHPVLLTTLDLNFENSLISVFITHKNYYCMTKSHRQCNLLPYQCKFGSDNVSQMCLYFILMLTC